MSARPYQMMINLGLWSVLILPVIGVAVGRIYSYLFFGYHKLNILVVYVIMSAFMITTINDMFYGPPENIKSEQKLMLIIMANIVILGLIFGMIL